MNLVITDEAEADLFDGLIFYEQQRRGVGVYFLESLRSDIESLRLFAGIHRVIHGCHKMLSNRFPYAIYYECEGDDVRVLRVLDCRRNPQWTERQVRKRAEWEE